MKHLVIHLIKESHQYNFALGTGINAIRIISSSRFFDTIFEILNVTASSFEIGRRITFGGFGSFAIDLGLLGILKPNKIIKIGHIRKTKDPSSCEPIEHIDIKILSAKLTEDKTILLKFKQV